MADKELEARWDRAVAEGVVRFLVKHDDCCDLNELFGDTFNVEANPDIDPDLIREQEKEEIQRANDEGVWGIVGEYKCPCCGGWVWADAVWGFVGDDWEGSGHDDDVKDATLKELLTHLIGEDNDYDNDANVPR